MRPIRFFKDLSIENKLISIILFTCIFSLILAGVAFLKFEINKFQDEIKRDSIKVAEIIAASVTFPLVNDDKLFAEEVLSALSVEKSITAASIIKNENEVFAVYDTKNSPNKNYLKFSKSKQITYKFGKDFFSLYRPIMVNNEKIGGIYIETSTNQLNSIIKKNLVILINALILITIFAFFISSKLQKMISGPILKLAQLADYVSYKKDYSVRANKESNDELGVLFDSFNDMLTQIDNRDQELQRAYDDLNKAQRLESLGLLAGGIAHDFNNLLTAIISNIELAKTYSNPEDELYELLDDIEVASDQSKSLTQQLLTFAKGGNPVKELTNMKDLVKNSVEFTLRGSSLKCDFYIQKDLKNVNVDSSQINQVLNNLVINAMQAMPDGGKIEVGAENIVLNRDEIVDLDKGEYVKVYVKDFGTGIKKENLTKIFDPYFTTKDKGSGLGLATSYSIIKKHDGYMGVESQEGAGTNFYFYLPAFGEGITRSVDDMTEEIKGKGKVLVMDDEELIRRIVEKQLNRIGYDVFTASDGLEAAEIYSDAMTKNQPFDIVIVDLTVPGGVGGKELVEKLVEIDPSVKAIVASGYSEDPVMAEYEKYHFKGCVKKPFNMKELAEAIEAVLSS